MFAAVIDQTSGGELRIELKPGVFVELHREQFEAPLESLTSGAIIRIENKPGNKFTITRATFGEARYLAEKPRIAVALPKQNLISEKVWDDDVDDDRYWRNNRCFTIGGLPNIEALPASYDLTNSCWLEPKASDFTKLMEVPHPKIVLLGYDHLSEFRVALSLDNLPVGRLEHAKISFNVRYIPLGNDFSDSDCQDLDWHLLSFADEPASNIIRRADREKWVYHDSETGSWTTFHRI